MEHEEIIKEFMCLDFWKRWTMALNNMEKTCKEAEQFFKEAAYSGTFLGARMIERYRVKTADEISAKHATTVEAVGKYTEGEKPVAELNSNNKQIKGFLVGEPEVFMELYGDVVGYPEARTRETQFGLSFLRLDRDMEPGVVVTIEPGIYFVPAILEDRKLQDRLGASVDWDRARSWLPFGGIRIEDDVLVTSAGCEVLSSSIPKQLGEIEDLVGTGEMPGRSRSGGV